MLQGKLKVMGKAREALVEYLLLLAEVRKFLPMQNNDQCMLCTSCTHGDRELFDQVDGSKHEQVSFLMYPD